MGPGTVSQKGLTIEQRISHAALELGFDVCKITSPELRAGIGEGYKKYLNRGHHGSMDWMLETMERRSSPNNLWQDVQSVIILAMNYGPSSDPLPGLKKRSSGLISVYAQNRDYHDLVKGKLKILAGKLAAWTDCDVKVFVDTAPVMEKPLAAKSGIGWQGKHTNLVSREFGSWLFLGSIFTTAKLKADASIDAPVDHCGNCRSCLDICPTSAFTAPHEIDARRCISYLTIENKGPIPLEFRKAIGNRIYGCDDCLAICPWNKFASSAREAKLQPREDLQAPKLEFLAGLDDAHFRTFFSGSPVKRIGRDRFLRNVLIAIGNSQNPALLPPSVTPHLSDQNPLVRGAAIWALRNLADEATITQHRDQYLSFETEETVKTEWSCNLERT